MTRRNRTLRARKPVSGYAILVYLYLACTAATLLILILFPGDAVVSLVGLPFMVLTVLFLHAVSQHPRLSFLNDPDDGRPTLLDELLYPRYRRRTYH